MTEAWCSNRGSYTDAKPDRSGGDKSGEGSKWVRERGKGGKYWDHDNKDFYFYSSSALSRRRRKRSAEGNARARGKRTRFGDPSELGCIAARKESNLTRSNWPLNRGRKEKVASLKLGKIERRGDSVRRDGVRLLEDGGIMPGAAHGSDR